MRSQPQQAWSAASSGANRFAVFAESEEEPEEATPREAKAKVAVFSEAEAEKELEVLLNGWVCSCPAFGGSTRQAACQEIEALVAWLPTQSTLYPGAAWQAAVARQLSSCEEALLCLII